MILGFETNVAILIRVSELGFQQARKIFSQFRNIKVPLIPSLVRCPEGGIVRFPIFSYSFRDYFLSLKQSALLHANQVITGCSGGAAVAFDKRVYPVQPPKRVGRDERRMLPDCPILVNNRKEPIHFVWDILKVGREMVADVDRFFAVTAAKLRDIGDRCVVQSPERVFVEGLDAFFEANFDAVRK